jgi:hypothetical protein
MSETPDFTDAAMDAAFESLRATNELAAQGLVDHSHDRKLWTEFYVKPVLNEVKSKAAGRPIYEDRDYIRYGARGQRDFMDVPYWDDEQHPNSHAARFGDRYAKWKAGQTEAALEGTPLSILATLVPPILTPSEVKEFEAVHVRSAEQLVELPDTMNRKFLGFGETKRKVQAYLDMLQAAAPQQHLRAELEERDMRIQAQEDRIRALEQHLAASGKAPPETLTDEFAAAAHAAHPGVLPPTAEMRPDKKPKAKAKR